MREKLNLIGLISILIVLSMVVLTSASEDVTPPQITIISPENDSIVADYLLSEAVIQTESWKIENGNDLLEIGEPISNVIEMVDGEKISALSDNTWLVKDIEYDYEQTLSFDSEDAQNEAVKFAEDDGKADVHFYIKEGQQIARYSVNFESPVHSKINTNLLPDYKGTVLTLFGKEFLVVNAERIYPEGVRLILMDKSSNVLELEDNDISDDLSISKLKINDQVVEGEFVKFKGTIESDFLSLSSIEVDMIAQDDYYVASGETLLKQPEFVNKDLLFTENWDITFDGLEPSINRNVPTHDISLDDPRVRLYEISIKNQAGEGEYWLTFTNVEDRKITFPIAYASNSIVSVGSKANRLNLENSNIAKGQYFILNTGTDENSVTNVVQYKQSYGSIQADGSSESNPKIFFTILATGETVQRLVSFDSNGVATATLKFSGTTYTITSVGDASKDNYHISITGGAETSNSNPYGFENYLIARGGAKITLSEEITDSNAKILNVNLSLIDQNNVGDSNTEIPYLVSSVNIIAVDNKIDFANYTGISLISPENDPENAYGYSINGALVKLNSPSDSTSDTLDMDWPKRQRLPQVYITTAIEIGTEQWLPLELSTDENTICSYNLGEEYEEMDTTGAKFHSQNLFDLEDGKDYEVSVQCVDESGNTNTELLKFHFGKVAEPAEEPPQQDQPSNSGGGGSSSSNDDDDEEETVDESTTKVKDNPTPEVKKTSEPLEQLAETNTEAPDTPSFSDKITTAVIGVAEDGGLLYVASFVLVIFSLIGIKIFFLSKK